jgi:hypothetical protein
LHGRLPSAGFRKVGFTGEPARPPPKRVELQLLHHYAK